MRGKVREYCERFLGKDATGPGRPRGRLATLPVRHTGGTEYSGQLKSGHAFYVVNPNNLFVRGVPFRSNYTQFSAGLP